MRHGECAIPALVFDGELSFRAIGALCYLYSYPADEPPAISDVVAGAPDGRDSVNSAMLELCNAGWVESLYVKARIPPDLRIAVLKRDGFRCVVCDADSDLMADHVIPEGLGGDTTFENLQTLCRPCNSHKGRSVGGDSYV